MDYTCGDGVSNSGVPTCETIAKVAKKLFIVPLKSSAGAKNQISISETLNEAFFEALVNQSDVSKRWFPTPKLDNIEDVRADAAVEAMASGVNIFLHDGVRHFKGWMVKQSPVLLGKLITARHNDIGVYVADKNNNLTGQISADGLFLNPIPVDNDSWIPILLKTTDTTVQKIQLDFDFSDLAMDEDLRMFLSTDFVDYKINSLEALLDVNPTISGEALEEFVVAMVLDYGSVQLPIKVKGWVKDDFTLYNETTPASVVITSVTEAPDGTYTFVIPTQGNDDILTLTAQLDGFEFPSTTIIMPGA